MNRSSIEVAPRAQKTGTFRSETSAQSCAETLAAGITSVNSRPGRPRCVWTVNGRACINRKNQKKNGAASPGRERMATVELRHIWKRFDTTVAVEDFSLTTS